MSKLLCPAEILEQVLLRVFVIVIEPPASEA